MGSHSWHGHDQRRHPAQKACRQEEGQDHDRRRHDGVFQRRDPVEAELEQHAAVLLDDGRELGGR